MIIMIVVITKEKKMDESHKWLFISSFYIKEHQCDLQQRSVNIRKRVQVVCIYIVVGLVTPQKQYQHSVSVFTSQLEYWN